MMVFVMGNKNNNPSSTDGKLKTWNFPQVFKEMPGLLMQIPKLSVLILLH